MANESPSPEVLDAFLTGAGARAEHYEIAAYEGLITMADAMGEDEGRELLTENLEQEKKALTEMKTGRKAPGKGRSHRRQPLVASTSGRVVAGRRQNRRGATRLNRLGGSDENRHA